MTAQLRRRRVSSPAPFRAGACRVGGRPNKPSVARERIAVLALQRLGDVLTGARVTDALARRRETATVELVHWDATAQAAAMLPGIARRHALPFGGLRRRTRIHPVAAVRSLHRHVDRIVDGGGFDTVVNLSSTRFACWLAPALLRAGGRVLGPAIDGLGRYVASHPAIDHLNDWGSDPELGVFAHQDLYALAAGVRLSGFAGLRDGGGRRDGPVVAHPFGSERSKDWRDVAAWRELVGRAGAALGRAVVVVGAPAEREALQAIALGTFATVMTCPLPEYAELLRDAAGLLSVDTVAIHLAAAVGCPTVVLRQGPARGHAFVPGATALCVDARSEPASIEDVLALALRQFSPSPVPLSGSAALLERVRVRAAWRDDHGLLGLSTPQWLRALASWHDEDRDDARWRGLWRSHWAGEPLRADVLTQLAQGRSEAGRRRWRTLCDGSGPLAIAARRVAAVSPDAGRSAA